MTEKSEKRKTKRVASLLVQHEASLIKELGPKAFELLTPAQVKEELQLKDVARITDITRQGWLAGVEGYDAGRAHLYHRWRVEFVKRYKGSYKKNVQPV